MAGFKFERLIADRGYAAQDFYDWLVQNDIEPVIPPYQCAVGRLAKRPYDQWWYRERQLIECTIGKMKQFRRVFSRFDKLSSHYLGFLHFVSVLLWLR